MSVDKIRNKISEAGLVTVDLLDFLPKGNRRCVNLKSWLYRGLIIKESDFKEKLKKFNPSEFKGDYVYIHCSEDVIIPTWAFLLLQIKLSPFAKYVFFWRKKRA